MIDWLSAWAQVERMGEAYAREARRVGLPRGVMPVTVTKDLIAFLKNVESGQYLQRFDLRLEQLVWCVQWEDALPLTPGEAARWCAALETAGVAIGVEVHEF